MNSTDKEHLYNLLPAIYRVRDKKEGEPLRALLAVIETEIQTIENDIEGLYANWFIETCEDWVVPYIGDLLGVQNLHDIGSGFSQRAYVANTLAYRRRKGTPSVIEQLARDVTGWHARVVEFFNLLAATQNMNHIRPACTIMNLRDAEGLDLLGGPFENAAHTVDVRRIGRNGGRYNIPNIGIFLWRIKSYSIKRSTARKLEDGRDGCYTFSPLGNDSPLFNQPQTEKDITHLAEEVNVPGMLRRRALREDLEKYHEAYLFSWNDIPEEEEENKRLITFLKWNFGIGWVENAEIKKIDDKTIKIYFENNFLSLQLNDDETKAILKIDDVRTDEFIAKKEKDKLNIYREAIKTSEAKSDSPYFGDTPVLAVFADGLEIRPEFLMICDLSNWNAPGWTQVAVDPVLGRLVFLTEPQPKQVEVSYSYGFSGDIGGGPYERELIAAGQEKDIWKKTVSLQDEKADFQTLSGALTEWANSKPNAIITITDNGTYDVKNSNIDLQLQAGRYLVIQANSGNRPMIRIIDNNDKVATLPIIGVEGLDAKLILSGLFIEGCIDIKGQSLELVRIVDCTLVPGWSFFNDGYPNKAFKPSVNVTNMNVKVEIDHSITGPLCLPAEIKSLSVRDSIIDSHRKQYWFSWNEIPGKDKERLIGFLKKRFNIEWADSAKIEKIDDDMTIRLSFGKNYLTLKLNDDETKVILKIDDGRTDEFIAKKEKEKLNIYREQYAISNGNGGSGPSTTIEQTTVFGKVHVKELTGASNVIFTDTVTVDRQQQNCVRYSFVPDGSRTLRHYRCQPDLEIAKQIEDEEKKAQAENTTFDTSRRELIKTEVLSRLVPAFTSTRYGDPGYGQLHTSCPEQIRTGADDGSEMGAFHHLKQPQRKANLSTALDEYLRFGLHEGILYVDEDKEVYKDGKVYENKEE